MCVRAQPLPLMQMAAAGLTAGGLGAHGVFRVFKTL